MEGVRNEPNQQPNLPPAVANVGNIDKNGGSKPANKVDDIQIIYESQNEPKPEDKLDDIFQKQRERDIVKVKEWLTFRVKMVHYLDKFILNGYESI